LENFDNTQWLWRQWVEMFLMNCTTEVWVGKKKGSRGNKRPETDMGEWVGKQVRSNVLELANTTFMIVIRRVPKINNDQTFSKRLCALFTDVRHWEELIYFMKKNCCPKKPYNQTGIFKCNLMQEELDEEYMG
jgi:hypothetical protein